MEEKFMLEAIKEAEKNGENNFKDGGPFGAVIVKNGKIVAKAHNTVIASKDPTSHAEINAIRLASKTLGTHDLSNCTLYTSAEPCPMCLSAIIWANIKTAYFANTKEDAEKIGFRDDMIYDFIKSNNSDTKTLELIHVKKTNAIKAFNDFENNKNSVIY